MRTFWVILGGVVALGVLGMSIPKPVTAPTMAQAVQACVQQQDVADAYELYAATDRCARDDKTRP